VHALQGPLRDRRVHAVMDGCISPGQALQALAERGLIAGRVRTGAAGR
jgi:hypothetical protein